jgi:hypothetical protein
MAPSPYVTHWITDLTVFICERPELCQVRASLVRETPLKFFAHTGRVWRSRTNKKREMPTRDQNGKQTAYSHARNLSIVIIACVSRGLLHESVGIQNVKLRLPH